MPGWWLFLYYKPCLQYSLVCFAFFCLVKRIVQYFVKEWSEQKVSVTNVVGLYSTYQKCIIIGAPNSYQFREKLTWVFYQKNLLKSKHFFLWKIEVFLRGHTRAILTSNHPYSHPSKNIWGLLAWKIEYSTKLSKKWFSSYYEMQQSSNFIVKTEISITRTFLNWSGWDLVWVNIYPRYFDTPNLIPIRWETAEFWGLVRFTRRERPCKWGLKNEPF